MTFELIISPKAVEERETIIKWYEKRSVQAADSFVLEFQNSLNNICNSPYRYRNTHKSLREIKMKKYPYHIIFHIDENNKNIVVVRVYHTSRNPDNKYKKLK